MVEPRILWSMGNYIFENLKIFPPDKQNYSGLTERITVKPV